MTGRALLSGRSPGRVSWVFCGRMAPFNPASAVRGPQYGSQ
jgi:hypothetical protein